MERDSSQDTSRFVEVFGTFGNICALNVLWLICCIPIFTIGASTTALYSVMLKVIDKKEGKITQSFFAAFKANFKKATIEWLITLAVLAVIVWELYFSYHWDMGGWSTFYMVVGIVELVVVALILPYVFPLTAKYENTVVNTFKNAFLLTVADPLSWLKIFLAWVAPVFISAWYPIIFFYTWYLWIICIVGFIAFGTSHTIRKVFNKINQAQEEKPENEKSQEEE